MTILRRVLPTATLMVALVVPIRGQPQTTPEQPPSAPQQQSEFVPISELPPQDQLPAAPLLIAAYSVVWVALFGYLFSVSRRLNVVQREVERLEKDLKRS